MFKIKLKFKNVEKDDFKIFKRPNSGSKNSKMMILGVRGRVQASPGRVGNGQSSFFWPPPKCVSEKKLKMGFLGQKEGF